MEHFDTAEYKALRSRVIAGESKFLRIDDRDGGHCLQEIICLWRPENQNISLINLFAHSEDLFEDAALSEQLVLSLQASLADTKRDNSILQLIMFLGIIVSTLVYSGVFVAP